MSARIAGAASTSTHRCLTSLRDGYERRIASSREVVELRERLDAGVACADEHEAEIALGLVRVEARRGRLERAQEPVAERDRVRDVLEPMTVLGEAGHGEGAWHGAERDHEPLVADLERAAESLRDHGLPRGIA